MKKITSKQKRYHIKWKIFKSVVVEANNEKEAMNKFYKKDYDNRTKKEITLTKARIEGQE